MFSVIMAGKEGHAAGISWVGTGSALSIPQGPGQAPATKHDPAQCPWVTLRKPYDDTEFHLTWLIRKQVCVVALNWEMCSHKSQLCAEPPTGTWGRNLSTRL